MTQQRETGRRGQQRVALRAAVPQGQHQSQQDERQHRRCEELAVVARRGVRRNQAGELVGRSEEHTSELQSHSDLVCRLLLEKKKKKRTTKRNRKKERNTQHTQD